MDVEFLTKFAGFLTEQVTDTNRPIIADFLEKFLVVEIKKLEVPEEATTLVDEIPKSTTVKKVTAVGSVPEGSKNGHKIEKVRDLTNSEKDGIRFWFQDVNGQIDSDLCVEYKKKMDPEVAIFQVTGFVTYMHLCVAMGKVAVPNLITYLEFLIKHRNLWATYNSPKYRAMRSRLGLVELVPEVA